MCKLTSSLDKIKSENYIFNTEEVIGKTADGKTVYRKRFYKNENGSDGALLDNSLNKNNIIPLSISGIIQNNNDGNYLHLGYPSAHGTVGVILSADGLKYAGAFPYKFISIELIYLKS